MDATALGKEVERIFKLPVTWAAKAAEICNLQVKVDAPGVELQIGSKERNAKLSEIQASERDTKASMRTAPGRESEPLPPRYVADEPAPKVVRKKASKKKATRKR